MFERVAALLEAEGGSLDDAAKFSVRVAGAEVRAALPPPRRGAAEILDFTEPVAVLILGVLGHIADTDEARSVAAQICARVPSGSYVAISDGTSSKERQKLRGTRRRHLPALPRP